MHYSEGVETTRKQVFRFGSMDALDLGSQQYKKEKSMGTSRSRRARWSSYTTSHTVFREYKEEGKEAETGAILSLARLPRTVISSRYGYMLSYKQCFRGWRRTAAVFVSYWVEGVSGGLCPTEFQTASYGLWVVRDLTVGRLMRALVGA